MRFSLLTAVAVLSAMPLPAQTYKAERLEQEGLQVVRLSSPDGARIVSVLPHVGNTAYEFRVHGKNVFHFPFDHPQDFAAKPRLSANPLLWPWANRLDHDGFFFAGKHFGLNADLGNVRRDPNRLPIHGLVLFTPHWKVVALEADEAGASVTSRLDYHEHPALAAQFPFAHRIEMTYRLSADRLEVATSIENLGAETMPLSIGYHPYFQLHDAPREQWKIRLAARRVWELNDKLTPTGQSMPIEDEFPHPESVSLADARLDHVFGELIREGGGMARFSVEGAGQKIEVLYGEGYDTAIVYAPEQEGDPFICFEPMAGITNAFNLAHAGDYDALQTIAPGGVWQAVYAIVPSGF